jgi:DNA-binding NtrC family response regulator
MSQPCVVVAESKTSHRELWISQLREAGFEAAEYNVARASAEGRCISVFVAGTGCSRELIAQMRARGIPVIFVAHSSSEQVAIDALRAGCADYLRMPFGSKDLIAAIARFQTKTDYPEDRMIGESATMRDLRLLLKRVARVRSNVLITGETGTGKELVAQSIHRQSDRASQRLVCVNCAAIPDPLVESELFGYEKGAFTGAVACHAGKLEAAEAGTVFLDEVGDMSLTAQAKILRAIESREFYRLGGHVPVPVNVRIVAATHRNLEKMVAEGQFRSDLLYRLNVARVHVAPLRERHEDIQPIARHCIRELDRELGTQVEDLSDELWEKLMNYSWPGNIRELKNMVEAFLIQSPSKIITLEDLPADLRDKLGENCREDERDRMLSALMSTRWNKSKAAEQLHWSRMTLYRKMNKYSVHSSSH